MKPLLAPSTGAILILGLAALAFWQLRPAEPTNAGPIAPLATASAAPGPSEQSPLARPLQSKTLAHPAPYIPAPCYTKTEDEAGRVHNPCFTCHHSPTVPNYIQDADLQLGYSFAEAARQNPWTNLFLDLSGAQQRPDADIVSYVRQDNYRDGTRKLLAEALGSLPKSWDFDGDGRWGGYVPDAEFRFDESGFDRDLSGRATGWRAFAYQPFPGTFWPTNGSAGDVLIRLPKPFRQDEAGKEDPAIYAVNLAVLESLIRRAEVPIAPVDERTVNVDLDRDGKLGLAHAVKFDWAPLRGRFMSYVGRARLEHERDGYRPAAGLFPTGTEFLHSVRYLDVVEGQVTMAARMKEVRYAVKRSYRNYEELENRAASETKEKRDFPDRLRQVRGDLERGVENQQGWIYQGFIEDAAGALRPQTYEESVACVGCHGGVAATTDGIFSFARKLWDHVPAQGWFHWSQHGLAGLPDRKRHDGNYEYEFYLRENGAGDELRANTEVMERFFDSNGALRPDALEQLRIDISYLLLPSPARALALDKAYAALVQLQTFENGRDAPLRPALNVHRVVAEDQPTNVQAALSGP
jgi:hypothetical protein